MKQATMAAALLLLAGPAAATCDRAQSQIELNECAGAAFNTADAKLNATYKQVMARLGPPGQARLKTAQRGWLAYRDAQCDFIASGSDGGSVAPMTYANCLAGETLARTKALAALAKCEEGDLSCPR